ncbi:MAG: hypothetical protein DMG88_20400 [Acidobacteria bacterium]|nr:MAG: hypothetical protein DMG88_20400 [Acidobacteriota bacterium]
MNSDPATGKILRKLSITLALLIIPTLAFSQTNKKPESAPAPAPRSAPAASAPRPSASAQRPATPANRGPAQNDARRPATDNNSARGPNAARGPATGPNAAGGTNSARGMNNARSGNGAGANAARAGNNTRGPNNAAANANRGMNNTRTGNATAANSVRNANASRTTVARHPAPPTTTREIKTRSGASVKANYQGGHVRSIQTHNMKIERSGRGQRRIETVRNGRRIVSTGGRRGYMERPYINRGGRAYVQRTYYVGGRSYVYAYRTYYYGGAPYYGYAPAYYYQPVYYGWAYNPWPQPVYYRWGYYNDPWYGNYNYYYAPYPAYPTASSWLTDYMISENLRAAYEASLAGRVAPLQAPFNQSEDLTASLWSSDFLIAGNLDAAYGGALYMSAAGKGNATASQAQLTPEVKQALADEVKQQIAADKTAAEGSQQAASKGDELPPALDPKHRIFIASSNLDVTTTDGTECQLGQGDVIERASDTADEDNKVEMIVKSAKRWCLSLKFSRLTVLLLALFSRLEVHAGSQGWPIPEVTKELVPQPA